MLCLPPEAILYVVYRMHSNVFNTYILQVLFLSTYFRFCFCYLFLGCSAMKINWIKMKSSVVKTCIIESEVKTCIIENFLNFSIFLLRLNLRTKDTPSWNSYAYPFFLRSKREGRTFLNMRGSINSGLWSSSVSIPGQWFTIAFISLTINR